MRTLYVKVSGKLELKDNGVLANNKGEEVVGHIGVMEVFPTVTCIFEHEDQLKCVKTGADVVVEEYTYRVDMYTHRVMGDYWIKARNLTDDYATYSGNK